MDSLNKIEISQKALSHNFAVCQQKAGNVPILAMIKADAYGHGAVDCAHIFEHCGASAFGVAEVAEGVLLREAGIRLPLLILAGVIEQTIPALLDYNLTPVIVDETALFALSRQAHAAGKTVAVHLKMDAGMGRLGTLAKNFKDFVQKALAAPGITVAGIIAHFPMADEPSNPHSRQVMACFKETLRSVQALVPRDCCFHLANSGGLFYVEGSVLHMTRVGIALYGYYPDGQAGCVRVLEKDRLQPAMRFSTRVIQVRTLPADTGMGYGHIYTTFRETKVAVIPVGYEDGYLRQLSTKGKALVRGRRVPVIGQISMNLTMLDVTDIPDGVQAGDEVVLLGRQGAEKITADEIAGWLDTISYEVLCLFGHQNHRVLVKD